MSTLPGKTVLITGANAGIGKDVARQLALRPEMARIYLACRNKDRATTAKAELEAETGRRIFDIIVMDVADPGSVRAGLAGINGSLDALVMNAGTVGGKTALDLTADGYFRVRVERSWPRRPPRGAPEGGPTWRGGGLRRKRSSQGSPEDADETAMVRLNLRRRARHCHRRQLFRRPQTDLALAFGQVKYIGALWMAYLARQHPDRRFITVSPGSTSGTQAPNDLALPLRVAAKYVIPALGWPTNSPWARGDW